VISRVGRLRGQLPEQFRGKSSFACLHCSLSLMAVEGRRNRICVDSVPLLSGLNLRLIETGSNPTCPNSYP
jgi:hypothetical protein